MSIEDISNATTQELYIEGMGHTKLAAYLFFPNNADSSQQYPVLWKHDRYHSINLAQNRAEIPSEGVDYARFITEALNRNYVVAFVDSRGSGCSFGYSTEPFSVAERVDMQHITDWFAKQPWCSGKVGMFGRSYSGIMQLFACTKPSKALGAIVPEMALFDLYDFVYPGGIFRNDFADKWGRSVYDLDNSLPIKPIEGEEGKALALQARQEHQKNTDVFSLLHSLPYRDSVHTTGDHYYKSHSPAELVKEIASAAVPTLIISGWFDLWVKDALLLYQNLHGPKKLIIGPWAHGGADNELLIEHQLDWYDFFLKDSGSEPLNTILFYTIGSEKQSAWQMTNMWPLPQTQYHTLHFTTHQHQNHTPSDYIMTADLTSVTATGHSTYHADFTTTSGSTTRWANGYGGDYGYQDMESLCQKALNYTTTEYANDVELTGHPILTLWIGCNAPDVDVIAYLLDVYPDGYVQYITEGCLRLSRRKLSKAPYENFSLPYHPNNQADLLPLKENEIVEACFDLHPISYRLKKGHRFRITLTCCDKDNLYSALTRPEPSIEVHSNHQFLSQLILPLIER